MQDGLNILSSNREREFWKRYHSFRMMVEHLKAEHQLMHQIRAETVIPEQARDMALKAISSELGNKHQIFLEFFQDFIGFCSQGLHKLDLFTEFTTAEGGIAEIRHCHLLVDGRKEEIPVEIGRRFIDLLPHEEGWEAVLAFYRAEETRYDRLFGGNLDRCSLVIREELFPARCFHIAVRLPAQTLTEYQARP